MTCLHGEKIAICRPDVERRKKIEDFDCPCCGSLWAQVTYYEWYDPIVECWFCGRQWAGGERLGYRSEVTLAMRASRVVVAKTPHGKDPG